jgi:hypothetical protein
LGFSITIEIYTDYEELKQFSDEIINWTIYADNAPPVEGSMLVADLFER